MAGEGSTLVAATHTELAASMGGDSSSFTSVGVEASVIVSLLVEFDESAPFKASGETAGDSALCVGSSGADLVLIT